MDRLTVFVRSYTLDPGIAWHLSEAPHLRTWMVRVLRLKAHRYVHGVRA